MELGIVEFELGNKHYRVSIVESEEDVNDDVDYYMYKTDVKNLEKGLLKVGKDFIDEKLLQFAIEKNVLKTKRRV